MVRANLRWEWALAAIVLAAAAAVAFTPVVRVLVDQWATNDTYSFGALVPIISAYFVWMQRGRLAGLPIVPAPTVGAVLVGACAVLFAVGRAIGVIGIQEIAMVLTVPAALYLLCGRRLVVALWFPILYLFLMLPIWEFLTDRFHYSSQLFSARLGGSLLAFAGVPVHRHDTYLELPNITLEVASVCSGVNFLIAVIAIGVPQAYLFLKGFIPRALVIAFAVMIAVLSNGIRIAIIGILSHYELTTDLHGPRHLLQGLFVSSIGIVALQAAIVYMSRRYPKPLSPAPPAGERRANQPQPWRVLAAATVMAIVLMNVSALLPSILQASSTVSPAEPLALSEDWRPLGHSLPMQFVQGGPADNLGLAFKTAGGILHIFAGDLAYAEPSGGLGYRRVSLPNGAALSEMPVQTSRGTIFVNTVSFQLSGQNTDVVYWYDLNGSTTSQITTAKLRAVWRLLTGHRPMPVLVVLSRSRLADDGSAPPLQKLVTEVFDGLRLHSTAPRPVTVQ
jgi:exosortase